MTKKNPNKNKKAGKYKLAISSTVVVVSLIAGFAIFFNGTTFLAGNVLGLEGPVQNDVVKKDPKEPAVFSQIAQPLFYPPVKMSFMQKTLDVEEVGVESDGSLSVPSTWYTAGWYKKGAKPGEEGNVIIDGHYDTNKGAPGAFWELKNLQIGDKVSLADRMGRIFYYTVSSKSYVNIDDPERSKVLESGKDKILTLITCGGIWDYKSSTYNKRLVITAVFDKMEKSW